MLRRSQLADEECGDTLSKLLADICKDRRGFAIAMAAAGSPIPNGGLPTAVAIDADATYKHRIRRELGLMFPGETVLLAEAGSVDLPQIVLTLEKARHVLYLCGSV